MKTLLLVTAACLAAFPSLTTATETPPSSASIRTTAEPATIDFDFAGGTLKECIDAFAQHESGAINVVASGTADLTVQIPAFTLRNAGFANVVMVLRNLVEERGMMLDVTDERGRSITCIIRRAPKQPPHAVVQPDKVQSFQMGPYLQRYPIDEIAGAIREAWELDPARKKEDLRVKFHPGTKILLVSGPLEAIYIAQDVIANLQRNPDPAPPANPPAPPSKS